MMGKHLKDPGTMLKEAFAMIFSSFKLNGRLSWRLKDKTNGSGRWNKTGSKLLHMSIQDCKTRLREQWKRKCRVFHRAQTALTSSTALTAMLIMALSQGLHYGQALILHLASPPVLGNHPALGNYRRGGSLNCLKKAARAWIFGQLSLEF